VRTSRPSADFAEILGRLGGDLARLRAAEIIRPSLESVFLELTGRRYDGPHGGGGSAFAAANVVTDASGGMTSDVLAS
jgi:ABC-2 type transport system ATP-binding protein